MYKCASLCIHTRGRWTTRRALELPCAQSCRSMWENHTQESWRAMEGHAPPLGARKRKGKGATQEQDPLVQRRGNCVQVAKRARTHALQGRDHPTGVIGRKTPHASFRAAWALKTPKGARGSTEHGAENKGASTPDGTRGATPRQRQGAGHRPPRGVWSGAARPETGVAAKPAGTRARGTSATRPWLRTVARAGPTQGLWTQMPGGVIRARARVRKRARPAPELCLHGARGPTALSSCELPADTMELPGDELREVRRGVQLAEHSIGAPLETKRCGSKRCDHGVQL